MKNKVAILGCGPAGLLAAHAAKLNGFEPTVFSIRQKSKMFGAMYLHKPIPGISSRDPEFIVDVIKTGKRAGYAKNVYGDSMAPCSWDHIRRGANQAWNLTGAYNVLWDMYQTYIVDWFADPSRVEAIIKAYPIVFSSIPLPSICCVSEHEFKSQPIWVIHAPADEFSASLGSMMYYNGYPSDGSVDGIIGPDWYRFSSICGYQAWEYSTPRNPITSVWSNRKLSEGRKPLETNCDCYALQIKRIGRFGTWEKGVLTHHAFEMVEDELVRIREGF